MTYREKVELLLEACFHVRNNLAEESKEVWEIEIAHLDHAIERAKEKEEYPCKARPLYWSKTYDGHCERETWECDYCLHMEQERETRKHSTKG